jgi:Zinc-binding loop region of homing endonuclease
MIRTARRKLSFFEEPDMKPRLCRELGLAYIHPDARSKVVVAVNRLVAGCPSYPIYRRRGLCKLGRKNPDTNGYIRLSLPIEPPGIIPKHRNEYLQHLLLELRYGWAWVQEKKNSTPKVEASHLCHRKRCLYPRHVLMEPPKANRARDVCKDVGHCMGSAVRGHAPTRCVLPVPNDERIAEIVGVLLGGPLNNGGGAAP